MATTVKNLGQGTAVTLLSTELNSLANNTGVVSSVGGSSGAFNPAAGQTNWDGYPRGLIELVLGAPSTTVTASTAILIYFLTQVDGTNYEDGSSSVKPARMPDVVIPLRAVSGAQRVIRRYRVPVGTFKVLAWNDGTGVTLASSNNTLKSLADTEQGV